MSVVCELGSYKGAMVVEWDCGYGTMHGFWTETCAKVDACVAGSFWWPQVGSMKALAGLAGEPTKTMAYSLRMIKSWL